MPVARNPGRHPPGRERGRERVARAGAGPLAGLREFLVEPTGSRSVATLDGLLGPELLCAHCVAVDEDEIALLASADVPVAHCPRSNALLGCGLGSAHRACGPPGLASGSAPTLRPRRRRSIPGTRCARPCYTARARERRPDALSAAEALALATLGGAARPRAGRRRRKPDSGEARRPHRRLGRRKPVRSRGRPRGGRRVRRLPGRSPRDDRERPDPLPSRRDRVARGTQHRKRRPRTNARVAPAPVKSDPTPAAVLGGPALLRPSAGARALDVRPAGRRLRDQLHHPRGRVGLDGDQPGARELLQRQLGDRGVAVRRSSSRPSCTPRARPPG